jgi:hypothetical protein
MSKHYLPQDLFSSNLANIAPAFANQRYTPTGERKSGYGQGPQTNMGAAEIYHNTNPALSFAPYATVSQKISGHENTNYGHSEPRLMLEGLRRVYQQDTPDPHEYAGPDQVLRSRNNNEALEALVRDPNPHRNYLDRTGRVVNMLSERPFCTTNGGCSQFMQDIAPTGSKFGHTVKYTGKFGDSEQSLKDVENAIKELGPAYLNYLRETNAQHSQTLPNAIRSVFGNSSAISPTSVRSSIVNEYPSKTPQALQSNSSSSSSSSMGLGHRGSNFSQPPFTTISSSPYSSSSISNQAFRGQRRDTPRPVRSTNQPPQNSTPRTYTGFSPSSSSSSSSISASSTGRGLGSLLPRSNIPQPVQPSSSSLLSSSMGSTRSTSPVLKRPRTISPHSSPTSSDEEWNQIYNDLQAKHPKLFRNNS